MDRLVVVQQVETGFGVVEETGFLQGQLLLAMPSMADSRFERGVIFICSHSDDGAMGLVINRLMDSLTFEELLEQLDIDIEDGVPDLPIHAGGPVETGRGFVLHSTDYKQDTSLLINADFGLTATVDILKAVARGQGPRRHLLALGYAGWSPGQIEREMQANAWLSCPATEELVFNTAPDKMWTQALADMGIDVSMLSSMSGRA